MEKVAGQDKWHEKWGLASLYDNPVPPPHFSGLVIPLFFLCELETNDTLVKKPLEEIKV